MHIWYNYMLIFPTDIVGKTWCFYAYILKTKKLISRFRNYEKEKFSSMSNWGFFFFMYFFSGTKHPREDNPILYYWAEMTGLHTQTFNIQIPKPFMITGHVINSSLCRNYSTNSVPHPSTILRGRCLTSVLERLELYSYKKKVCSIRYNWYEPS